MSEIHPVFGVLQDRSKGEHDNNSVALVIEAGGTKGAYTAGMLLEMVDSGINQECFDKVYACSVGAFNALYFLSGNEDSGAKVYTNELNKKFFNPLRALIGRAPIDIDYVINILVTDPNNLKPVMLKPAKTVDELKTQIRATCHIALMAGKPPVIGGKVYFDGTLSSPLPFEFALEDGATHILALSSRELVNWRIKQNIIERAGTWLYDFKYRGVHAAIKQEVEKNAARSAQLKNAKLLLSSEAPYIYTLEVPGISTGKTFELDGDVLAKRIEFGRRIMKSDLGFQ
jgi:predicted patatin/cPLA2 family phospholipase